MNRTAIRAIVLGLLAVLAVGGVALATPASGATPTTLGRGTLESGDKINTHQLKLAIRQDLDVVTQTITFVPGGHFGWHSHPGPVFVTIVAGTLTFYDSDAACTSTEYRTGDSFIDEGGGHVHFARNEGTTDLVLYATYLVPVGAPLRIDAADPGFCPA
jgi:quercetin dioxygenase-like cupin family protein